MRIAGSRGRRVVGGPPRAAALLAVVFVVCGAAAQGGEPGTGEQGPGKATRLVVLPTLDLALGKADLELIDTTIEWRLRNLGFDVVPEIELNPFLVQHRIRYTGGASMSELAAMREGLGADAIFMASVGLFDENPPPRIALTARVVTTLDGRIRWTGTIALGGEDHPGLIGSGVIDDVGQLSDLAIRRLLDSLRKQDLARNLPPSSEVATWKQRRGRSEHRPVKVFRAEEFDEPRERTPRVAVLPFENNSSNDDAAEVVAGLFASHLAGKGLFEVIEPGEVRDKLLLGRVIQIDGLSLPQGDWVREMLDADLAVTGSVTDYTDFGSGTVSRVGFSVWIIDVRRRRVVWSAFSSNQATDGVVFFEVGRMTSARALAGGMVRAAVDVLTYDSSSGR